MKPRQLVLGGALLGTLAATAWVATRPEEDAASPALVAQPARRPLAAAADTAKPTSTSEARQPWAEANPAQLAAWRPPPPPPPPSPPPPAAPEPPPAPTAPPVPYRMIGRVVEGEGAQAVEVALLTGPNKSLSVRQGDVINDQWRVEQVSTRGVSLTWLPAKLPQNIVFKTVP